MSLRSHSCRSCPAPQRGRKFDYVPPLIPGSARAARPADCPKRTRKRNERRPGDVARLRILVYKNSPMGKRATKRGRPATGQAPAVSLRLPNGWIRQIDRTVRTTGKSRSIVARALIGAALASRKVKSVTATAVDEIDLETARHFTELWHYSGTIPKGRNIFFGWFVEGGLYAVANYGIGINQVQHKFLAHLTGLPVTRRNLFELKRLCRVDPAREGYQLSQFIATCHRILKRKHGIRFVVSFSDPAHNRFKQGRRKGVAYTSGGILCGLEFPVSRPDQLGMACPRRERKAAASPCCLPSQASCQRCWCSNDDRRREGKAWIEAPANAAQR
jgi:hypothetical protein